MGQKQLHADHEPLQKRIYKKTPLWRVLET